MEFYRFDKEVRRDVQAFDSKNVGITPIIREDGYTSAGCMHFDVDSVLGMHEATCPQLFLVVDGDGWVRVEGEERVPVSKGTAVFWTKGENHESGSETGMAAMIFEGPDLNPEQYLKKLK